MALTPLWRNRDFVLLQSGQLLSALGSEATAIAYPLLALALTHSPASLRSPASSPLRSSSSRPGSPPTGSTADA